MEPMTKQNEMKLLDELLAKMAPVVEGKSLIEEFKDAGREVPAELEEAVDHRLLDFIDFLVTQKMKREGIH